MPIETVLLDLGNVLVFHEDAALLARFAQLSGRAPAQVEEALRPIWDPCHRGRLAGDDLRTAIADALQIPALDDETFFEAWNCHFRVHHQVLPLVEGLVGRVRLLLLSNTNATHLRFVRAHLPLLDRFDGLVLSYELGLAKPDRAIFEAALARAGSPADRTAFFDDVGAYVDAARALGIHGHLFTDATRFAQQLRTLGL